MHRTLTLVAIVFSQLEQLAVGYRIPTKLRRVLDLVRRQMPGKALRPAVVEQDFQRTSCAGLCVAAYFRIVRMSLGSRAKLSAISSTGEPVS